MLFCFRHGCMCKNALNAKLISFTEVKQAYFNKNITL